MKVRLIFTLIMFVTITAKPMKAQSWTDTNNRWHIQVNCISNFNDSEVRAYFLKDSLLQNGKVYRQMYETLDTTFQTATPTGNYYREENGRVYTLKQGVTDRLIYDFNLRTDDTLTIDGGAFKLQIKVLSTDSVALENGSKRKRLIIQDNTPFSRKTTTWIEGIGSDQAPLDTWNMFVSDCQSNLRCFYQQNELTYQARFNNFPLGCDLYSGDPVSVDDLPALSEMRISPNPFATELYLNTELLGTSELNGDYTITVFDNQGRQMYQNNVSWINEIRIHTSNWSSGLYFLLIRSSNGMLSRKLVKI